MKRYTEPSIDVYVIDVADVTNTAGDNPISGTGHDNGGEYGQFIDPIGGGEQINGGYNNTDF